MNRRDFIRTAAFGSAFAANTWYVDDDWYGKEGRNGTAEAPWGTIQEAVDASDNWDLVLVAPGRYTVPPAVDKDEAWVSVVRAVRIYSTEGPEKTFFDGGWNGTASSPRRSR